MLLARQQRKPAQRQGQRLPCGFREQSVGANLAATRIPAAQADLLRRASRAHFGSHQRQGYRDSGVASWEQHLSNNSKHLKIGMGCFLGGRERGREGACHAWTVFKHRLKDRFSGCCRGVPRTGPTVNITRCSSGSFHCGNTIQQMGNSKAGTRPLYGNS